MAAEGLHYHRVPMNEFDPPTLRQLEDGTQWVLGEMAASRAVLVHCRLGLSRSVCMACAVLIRGEQTFEEAFRVVRSARPGARLTEGQLIRLAEFAKQGR